VPESRDSRAPQRHSCDRELAPAWHTAVLVGVILLVAGSGALLTYYRPSSPLVSVGASRIASIYLPAIAAQWGLVVYVCRVGRGRSRLASLLGESSWSARQAAADLGLASMAWLAIMAINAVTAKNLPIGTAASLASILPRTPREHLAWVPFAVSTGFCEEVVYRGYLQRQFRTFLGHTGLAVLLQAALFGIAHAHQGGSAMVRVAISGIALGALAEWRRSLRPGILGHAWTNLASGLLPG
jgi:membrane protease YdiL (CAAX protease family)